MQPFDGYREGGKILLGALGGSNARRGYGLALQRLTGQESCAYCGINLVDDFDRWLLLSVDHVVPAGEAKRLGIPVAFYQDAINLVLCCSACNGFDNRCRVGQVPRNDWTLEEFVTLRDAVFAERRPRIAARRDAERSFFAGQPWRVLPS